MQELFPLVRRTVRTEVTCACVVVSRAERIETGHIKANTADGAFLGSDFFGRLFFYGNSLTLSHDFHISTTAILAHETITRNNYLAFILP
jgi:hypothetical protein